MAVIPLHENALSLLQIISDTMSQKLSFDEAMTRVLKMVCEATCAEAGFIVLPDQKVEAVVTKLSYKQGDETLFKASLILAPSVVKTCLQNQEPIHWGPQTLLQPLHPFLDGLPDLKVRNVLCAPLHITEAQLGAIALINKNNGFFDDSDQAILLILAGIISQMLHSIDLVQELKIANADLEANRWEIIRSRNTLRALFDNVPLSFYIVDSNYYLLAINIARARRSLSSPQDLVGKRCYEALFQRYDPCPACRMSESLREGTTTNRTNHHWQPDGDAEEWEISSYPVYDEAGKVSQVILSEENVTEKRQLEYRLIQSEKLAAVGQLAAGIAHEINNPLTAVLANVQIIQRELPQDHDLQDSLELIGMAGARAAQVVRNLLDLTRKENYKFIPTDINETIQKALDLLQHEMFSHTVELNFVPANNLPELLASPEHLEGVWINLLSNAFDAVDHTGQGKITISSFKKNNHVQVMVTDNGHGISPERITRLFDPFYTTKEVGHGTGLGLTISQRIVKQHGGHIQVNSQLEKGTEFTVILPIK
ncbi:MAG TPA: ATP-binding protein [Anaerolineales bacterium]|nr:ATP-binding protein [Anaerolineales bacterium]